MNRSDIVGYTLAEIALALLFAIVAILLPAYAKTHSQLVDDAHKQAWLTNSSVFVIYWLNIPHRKDPL